MALSAYPKLSIQPLKGGFAYNDMILFSMKIKEYQLGRQIFKKKQIFHNVMMQANGYDNYVILDPSKPLDTIQSKGRGLRRGSKP